MLIESSVELRSPAANFKLESLRVLPDKVGLSPENEIVTINPLLATIALANWLVCSPIIAMPVNFPKTVLGSAIFPATAAVDNSPPLSELEHPRRIQIIDEKANNRFLVKYVQSIKPTPTFRCSKLLVAPPCEPKR